MKVVDSFIADNAEGKITVNLLQYNTKYNTKIPFLIKHFYQIEHSEYPGQFLLFYTKFFAKRAYNKIKSIYESDRNDYRVYEVGGRDVK